MNPYTIEQLSLKQWPAIQTINLGGWQVRLANGFTKRANSVSVTDVNQTELQSYIEKCEQIYEEHQLPTTFKLTSFAHADELDHILQLQGYKRIDTTNVMIKSITDEDSTTCSASSLYTYRVKDYISVKWLADYCRLSMLSESNIPTIIDLLTKTEGNVRFVQIFDDKKVIAVGMTVITDGIAGFYNIIVDSHYRKQGVGTMLMQILLQQAKLNGAESFSICVVADNIAAVKLYRKLGFTDCYQYWYRQKPIAKKAVYMAI